MNNACEICQRRPGAEFVTVSKQYLKYKHVVKAHVCGTCHGVLIEQMEFDGTTVDSISQQEYNELPAIQDIPT